MLEAVDRLLLEVDLKPRQGTRIQPTGYPDLGPQEYRLHDNTSVLLVESPQSMANRLEDVCLNHKRDGFVETLDGIAMIKVTSGGRALTNSVDEAHRASSHYIFEGKSGHIKERFDELKTDDNWDTSLEAVAPIIFGLDTNSLLHGLWISRKDVAGGRIRIPRALSSFIEARNVTRAIGGGVKIDHVKPETDESVGGAKKGQGNVPFTRIEYVAEKITAYFNLDLQQIRKYRLDEKQTDLLVNWALWKIRRFLDGGLRLRTACDLMIDGEMRATPSDFRLPNSSDLDASVKQSISSCKESLTGSEDVEYGK